MAVKNQPYVLITGAGSALAKEIAKIFAEDGYSLLLADHDNSCLRQLETSIKDLYPMVSVSTRSVDFAKPGAAEQLYQAIKEEGKKVSVLVNNTRPTGSGMFIDTPWEEEIIALHSGIIFTTHLTKLCLKDMAERNEGKILQVIPLVSLAPAPRNAVYGACGAFLYSFSEAILEEIKDLEVTLTVLCPSAGADGRLPEFPSENDHPLTIARHGYYALMKGNPRVMLCSETEWQSVLQRTPSGEWMRPDAHPPSREDSLRSIEPTAPHFGKSDN